MHAIACVSFFKAMELPSNGVQSVYVNEAPLAKMQKTMAMSLTLSTTPKTGVRGSAFTTRPILSKAQLQRLGCPGVCPRASMRRGCQRL